MFSMKYTWRLLQFCSKYESSAITSVVIYATQLCCMPFAFDASDLLLINIQRYFFIPCTLNTLCYFCQKLWQPYAGSESCRIVPICFLASSSFFQSVLRWSVAVSTICRHSSRVVAFLQAAARPKFRGQGLPQLHGAKCG